MQLLCLVLSDDLLDASRVIGEGRAAGLQVIQCKDRAALLAATDRKPAIIILDLHNPGLDTNLVVPSIKGLGAKLIGYGSHVDAVRLRSARQAGCDEVLPRSAFFEGLGDRLRGWADASLSQ